jgi:hypothetical protein
MDLLEIKWEYNGALRQIFIDFKKAYVSFQSNQCFL